METAAPSQEFQAYPLKHQDNLAVYIIQFNERINRHRDVSKEV